MVSGVEVPAALGGCWLQHSYEISIGPSQEDPLYEDKQALLVNSGLGHTHFLSANTSSDRLLAALAVICMDGQALSLAGAGGILNLAGVSSQGSVSILHCNSTAQCAVVKEESRVYEPCCVVCGIAIWCRCVTVYGCTFNRIFTLFYVFPIVRLEIVGVVVSIGWSTYGEWHFGGHGYIRRNSHQLHVNLQCVCPRRKTWKKIFGHVLH